MLVFYCALISGTSVKTYFNLRSDTVSEGVACGGIGSSLLEVSEIFNNVFLVGSPYSKKIAVVEGGEQRSVMISFSACLKKSNLTPGKGYS